MTTKQQETNNWVKITYNTLKKIARENEKEISLEAQQQLLEVVYRCFFFNSVTDLKQHMQLIREVYFFLNIEGRCFTIDHLWRVGLRAKIVDHQVSPF